LEENNKLKLHDGFIDGESKFLLEELMGKVILHDKRKFIGGTFPSYEFNNVKEAKIAAVKLLNGEKIISSSTAIKDFQNEALDLLNKTDSFLKKINRKINNNQ